MLKRLFLILMLSLIFLHMAEALEIKGPYLDFKDSVIRVSFQFDLDSNYVDEIRKGISKEVIFYIDLFRLWKTWPDEFIAGRKVVRNIKSDPMKKEYIATSFDGETLVEKRFNSFDSMMKWALNFNDVYLTSLKGMPSGTYFVRTTVESRLRNIPSLFGEIFFFLPDREFKVSSDSGLFRWNESSLEPLR
ncbi:MAG: DUF4390 domain-containing protein [Nitrospirota bacterium]|nr:DUF4390 domain-containing protein [Nitrospirota bacterium]